MEESERERERVVLLEKSIANSGIDGHESELIAFRINQLAGLVFLVNHIKCIFVTRVTME